MFPTTPCTGVATLPAGSQRDMVDPFAEKKRPWKLWLFLIVVLVLALCWWRGKLDSLLPHAAKSTTVFGTNAPAYKPPLKVELSGTNAAPVAPAK